MNIEAYYKTLPLPDCAVSINGEYLENTIIGYRTSSVSNRKTYSTAINDIEIGKNPGTTYIDKRDESNDMQVTFALVANTKAEYNQQVNKIAKILHDENLKIVFHDEDDRYFICNCSGFTAQEFDASGSGVFAGAGQYSLRFSDPYAYSVKEFEVEPTLDNGTTFVVDYNGDIPAKPIFEVTMQSDNGFVGFIDQNGNILQFGNVDDADGEDYEADEMLLLFNDLLSAHNDVGGRDCLHPEHGTSGSLGTVEWFGKDFLYMESSGPETGPSNGGLRTIEVPMDSNGDIGATNWYSYFHALLYAILMGQTGEMSISFLTKNNQVIAAYNWHKTDTTGNTAYCDFICYDENIGPEDSLGGKMLQRFKYTTNTLKEQNPWYWDWGYCDIRKIGNSITYYYNGCYYTFTVPGIEDLVCTKIQVSIKQLKNRGGDKFFHTIGLDDFKFQITNVKKWKDIPNKFMKGDLFVVNTNDYSVNLKNMPQYGLGAIDNAWDEFSIVNGNNQIKVVYSNWVTEKPIFKLKYREVYIC